MRKQSRFLVLELKVQEKGNKQPLSVRDIFFLAYFTGRMGCEDIILNFKYTLRIAYSTTFNCVDSFILIDSQLSIKMKHAGFLCNFSFNFSNTVNFIWWKYCSGGNLTLTCTKALMLLKEKKNPGIQMRDPF